MVDGGGLENHCTGNRTGGSNPSPSAIRLRSRRIQASYGVMGSAARDEISPKRPARRRTNPSPSASLGSGLFRLFDDLGQPLSSVVQHAVVFDRDGALPRHQSLITRCEKRLSLDETITPDECRAE